MLIECKNNGTCIGTGSSSSCHCVIGSGYTGDLCEIAICSPPCQNSGVCTSPNKCSCPFNDFGQYCETQYCPNGCQHGGICVDPISSICDCTATGWTGTDCTFPVCNQDCGNKTCVLPNLCAYVATTTINFGGNITNCVDGNNFYPSYGCTPVNTSHVGTFNDPIPAAGPGYWTVQGIRVLVSTSICSRAPGFTGASVIANLGSFNLSTYNDIPVCSCNPPNIQFTSGAIISTYSFGGINTVSSQVVNSDPSTAFCLASTGTVTIAYDITPPAHTTGRITTGSSYIIVTTGGVSATTTSTSSDVSTTAEITSAAVSISVSFGTVWVILLFLF